VRSTLKGNTLYGVQKLSRFCPRSKAGPAGATLRPLVSLNFGSPVTGRYPWSSLYASVDIFGEGIGLIRDFELEDAVGGTKETYSQIFGYARSNVSPARPR
jgi:hypothetical protein